MSGWTVVTGGASGIGSAISRELARRGHRVVVADIDLAAAEAVAHHLPDAVACRVDVTHKADLDALADQLTADGGVDVWVSNAGISRMAPFLDVTEESFEATMAVNVKGVFLGGQAAARVMREHARGVIVNMASTAGRQGGVPFFADYVASKFAVVGLTQAMAVELAQYGIRVNCVCPGYVATPMQTRELEWEGRLRDMTADEVAADYVAQTPLGRLQSPEDVAHAVGFLVSAEASFITGEALVVNGGLFMG